MTPENARSLALYALWAFIGATVATGTQLAIVVSGTDAILIRPLVGTFLTSFFGALAAVGGTSQLARYGSERLAKQVDALKTQGVEKADMVVVAQDDLSHVTALNAAHMPTADEIAEAVDRLHRKRVEERLQQS